MKKTFAVMMVVLLATVFGFGTSAAALIVNGGFESGNTDFTSAYTYNHADYYAPGVYDVNTDPRLHHSSWTSYPAHSGQYMMIVNGANESNVSVWASQTSEPLVANTNYYFSAWVASSYATSPAVLSFSVNGAAIGAPFTASSTTGEWKQFHTIWNSGSNTSATLGLINMNTEFTGNDFTLDDIGFSTSPVPIPGTLALMGSGLLTLVLTGARRKFRR